VKPDGIQFEVSAFQHRQRDQWRYGESTIKVFAVSPTVNTFDPDIVFEFRVSIVRDV
jgi:hypothetical protein